MASARRIGVALQGGGAHGAFTWGVLDRLVDEVVEGRLEIAAISGTSAGALNGAALALGLLQGPVPAREMLAKLWRRNSELSEFNPLVIQSRIMEIEERGAWNIDDSNVASLTSLFALRFSPYDLGALYHNLLEPLIDSALPDLDRLNGANGPALFICATQISDNSRKIFRRPHITRDALLASACLPTEFKAIEIGKERYWDGGYLGNPALKPLFDRDETSQPVDDIIVIRTNPLLRTDGWPTSARQIADRLNEITFNAALILEADGICTVNKLLAHLKEDSACRSKYREIRLHMIADDPLMQALGYVSKFNPYPPFLDYLHGAGRRAADTWLARHINDIGACTTWNIDEDVKKKLR